MQQNLRAAMYIMEREITNLIACAPEYWNFRHRAVDFTDPISMVSNQKTEEPMDCPIIEKEPIKTINPVSVNPSTSDVQPIPHKVPKVELTTSALTDRSISVTSSGRSSINRTIRNISGWLRSMLFAIF
jgi:hypothetical protein